LNRVVSANSGLFGHASGFDLKRLELIWIMYRVFIVVGKHRKRAVKRRQSFKEKKLQNSEKMQKFFAFM
jgi:hypothetical protein